MHASGVQEVIHGPDPFWREEAIDVVQERKDRLLLPARLELFGARPFGPGKTRPASMGRLVPFPLLGQWNRAGLRLALLFAL